MNIKQGPRVKLAVNKSLLKEYTKNDNRVVYMNDGQEFQIQLFNPYTYTIGAELTINNEKQHSKIVLRPGERIWLDRYIDVAKKLKVSTYEVDANDADVNAAIKYNGQIKVAFYKENLRPKCPDYLKPIYIDPYKKYYDNNTAQYPYNGTITWTSAADAAEDTTIQLSNISSVNAYYTSAENSIVATDSITYSASSTSDSADTLVFSEPTKETARVDYGAKSKQEFIDVDLDFEFYSFATETIYIYPMSRKPFTSTDANKKYCYNCGKKLSPKFKFCPSCGSAQ